MEPFRNEDITIEVLSRLPVKSLATFRCTARRWNNLISIPWFLQLHSRRVRALEGLFVQRSNSAFVQRSTSADGGERDLEIVFCIRIANKEHILQDHVLHFLPEKVVVMTSSNGFLCCRPFMHRSLDDVQDFTIQKE